MPRRHDILLSTFRAELKRLGFAFHPLTRSCSDLRHPGAAIPAAMAGRAVNRLGTITALIVERARRVDIDATKAAAQAEHERIAAAIAPQAFTPARDTLEDADAVAALADDFVSIAARGDSPTMIDLLRLGWRRAQVWQYLESARHVAYQRQGGVAA